ncbi:EAL domain-containing protein [Noviherbaspirillum aridicola]|uniref:Diguanylate cyclase DosC n=1 Tax=Noviherbaspirillum aridicola TaxID=2849687 RepID=A0ABQ4PZ85_9BURK|nr:EAL domain-containing protein [Noviherbaspirillum aridicola]GIZ50126.1 hypothetical protein NCCP691_01400 [Noviherbaspirillum aridicola]
MKTLVTRLGLSEEEMAERKQYLELGERDCEVLRAMNEQLGEHGGGMADSFYAHLLKYPELGERLGDHAALQRLKQAQAVYFRGLTAGRYDMDYVEDRLRVGVAHQRIGLDPKWYIGAYRKYMSYLLPVIHDLYAGDRERTIAACDALFKVISLDMGLALDTYFEVDRQEILRHKEYAEQIISGLPAGLIVLDEQLLLRSINPAMRRLLDLGPRPLAGQHLSAVIDDPALADKLAQVQGGGTPALDILIRRDVQGEERYIDFHLARLQLGASHVILIIGGDVSERIRARAELRESEERFRLTFSMAGVGLAHLSVDGRILRSNRRLQDILGYSEDELRTIDYDEITHPGDRGKGRELLDRLLRNEIESFANEKRFRHKSGRYVWSNFTLSLVRREDGSPRYFISVIEDITERKQTAEKLIHLAQYDALTQLPNRTLLQDRLLQAVSHAGRNRGRLAVLFLDLDRFKDINDSLGHAAGDTMLRQIAARLSMQLRESDTVARLGGDEFVILLRDVQKDEQVAAVARKILDAVTRQVTVGGVEFMPTCSIGISIYPKDGRDGETLLRNADAAMYRAKENGRNSYYFYSEGLNEKLLHRLHIESGLRHALEQNEFSLHYQPQVDAVSGEVVGVEALLRWKPSSGAPVGPDEFIPIAEETGLIVPIGEWVLREACAQAAEWRRDGIAPLNLTVNVSLRQFRSDIASAVATVLRDTGFDPRSLTLELTESVLMESPELVEETLQKLKALGVRIAIDDFGTGYSSLAYLSRFSIDTLKIDRTFVLDLPDSRDDVAIVKAIVALGKALNLSVVAEGVETAEQADLLRGERCDVLQGYLFGRPLPPQALRERLLDARAVLT